MKTFIFCGGFGTRLNQGKPGPLKPLIKINKKTILEYIFEIYNKDNHNDFYLLGGYKIDELYKFSKKIKKYNVSVIDTKIGSPTGARLNYIKNILKKKESFFLTYGDSLANFKPNKALQLKKKNDYIISSSKHYPTYGVLNTKNNKLKHIYEKNFSLDVNAGFYVLDRRIFDFIKGNNDSFEKHVLPRIIKKKKKIGLFNLEKWCPIDTIYDIENVKKLLKKDKKYFYV